MILKSLRNVAADSNVLLSAVIGKAALKVFTRGSIGIVTTEFNVEEVRRYLPVLGGKYGIDPVDLALQLNMLPIKIYGQRYYQSKIALAKKYLHHRDPDDVHLAALALKEGIPVWSNDKDFEDLKIVEVFSTKRLLSRMGL